MASYAANRPARARQQVTTAAEPVLEAKITAPNVPDWAVARPRISEMLANGPRWNPLTVVTGPPGAGKTMALALWAAAEAGAVGWVTLDGYDNRPKAFWSHVVAALRRVGVAVPSAPPAKARGAAAGHLFLLRLAAALAAQDPPVTLVLDDFHVLTEPRILDGLDYVLRNVGPGLRLMAASRVDPFLPLHRYRLAGELAEIRAADLAFSIPEAIQLMAQHSVTLTADSLESLTRRTEGWAAGLRLAAISMDSHPDPDQFIKELVAEDSAVTSYLVEEVLDAQPARIRDFLLRTSILDRVGPDIAAELAGTGPDPGLLPSLAQANAFIQPVGGGWYRFHSLFSAVLRLKLRHDHAGQVPDLHRRAAGWYRRNGSITEAVRHAAAAGDWPLAARTVVDELAVGRLIESQGYEPLADEFRRMPAGPRTEPPPLLVAAAIELADGHEEACGTALAAAESILQRLPADHEIASRLAAALIRVGLSRRSGDLDAAIAAAARAENLLEAVPVDLAARRPGIRAQVLSARGAVAFWSGHFDAAAAALEAGMVAACAADSEDERADCLGNLALVEALRGRLRRAAQLATEAGVLGDDPDRAVGPISPAAEVALASVYLDRNELSLARGQLKRAADALRARPDKLVSAVACLVAARYGLADGHTRATSEIVDHARCGWSAPSWLARGLTLAESRAAAAVADIRSAVDLAVRSDPASSLDATVALANAWLAAGDPQAARHALASAPAEPAAADAVRVAKWLADAQLSYGSGDASRGRQSLEHALRLSDPEQLRLPFVLERSWLQPVLRRDPGLATAYRHLLEPYLVSTMAEARSPGTGQVAPVIVERLTEREREVLGLVSMMLSTAEIAAEMYISVNTVKTHLRSIYRKLAASHRGEAVRRARQLELL
jgi:LuxR family maltose regulon positive regulatory protein